MTESIRQVIKARDQFSDAEIDELFEEAEECLADGDDPDEVLSGVFGLEPDYFFDEEFQSALRLSM